MLHVSYEEAVSRMASGLALYIPPEDAEKLARIFADNSADGVHSHGMNRFPRYINDIKNGICNPSVRQAEFVSGMGGFEVWDAHFGVGPLIAEQVSGHAAELAKTHGVSCCAVRNNSHWLRAGRYAFNIARQGMYALCFTNTCQNLTPWGAKAHAIGNNPIAIAVPRKGKEPLLMDMAVSQFAYGKLEIMAQQGKTLDEPMGYDTAGNLTCDPGEIARSGLMFPIAKWKGNALSIMLDFMAAGLSFGRTSLMIGPPSEGEAGMSQVFLAMNPAALDDPDEMQAHLEESISFLHDLPTAEGMPALHVPGENLSETRRKNLSEGLPVTEETWAVIRNTAKA